MKYLILSFLISSQAQALDFKNIIENIKKETKALLGKIGTQENSIRPFEMPEIPEVKIDRKSVEVYSKEGRVYKQGEAFLVLSKEEKRKYRIAFLKELYISVRGAKINDNELIQGLNILEQGGTREGVYRSLVMSTEYMSLENYEEKPSSTLVDFTLNFGVEFLGLQFEKPQIEKLNLYTIKKVIVEKTLELVDSFPKDGENLYKWYAYLSVDFSKRFTATFRNKVRKSSSLEHHYQWAKQAPFQQIKSELIIKLHKGMNSLN